jgi:hypothetical protein
MAQQIRPEAIQLLSAADIKGVEAQVQSDQAPKECLQAGPFDEGQAATLRKALDGALPSGSWQLDSVKTPARWILYMGPWGSLNPRPSRRLNWPSWRPRVFALRAWCRIAKRVWERSSSCLPSPNRSKPSWRTSSPPWPASPSSPAARAGARQPASACRNRRVKLAPGALCPGRLSSTEMVAWCWRAISSTMGRPSPEPSASLPKAR